MRRNDIIKIIMAVLLFGQVISTTLAAASGEFGAEFLTITSAIGAGFAAVGAFAAAELE